MDSAQGGSFVRIAGRFDTVSLQEMSCLQDIASIPCTAWMLCIAGHFGTVRVKDVASVQGIASFPRTVCLLRIAGLIRDASTVRSARHLHDL